MSNSDVEVHLFYDEVENELLKIPNDNNIKMYFMHVDDIKGLKEKIKNTPFEIANAIQI